MHVPVVRLHTVHWVSRVLAVASLMVIAGSMSASVSKETAASLEYSAQVAWIHLPCTVGYRGPGRMGQRIHDGGAFSAMRISLERVHLRHLQADGLLLAVVK